MEKSNEVVCGGTILEEEEEEVEVLCGDPLVEVPFVKEGSIVVVAVEVDVEEEGARGGGEEGSNTCRIVGVIELDELDASAETV